MKISWPFVVCRVSVLISGCVPPRPPQTTVGGVHLMVGKPVDFAIDALGYPTSDRQIVGHRVITWEINEQVGTRSAFDSILMTNVTRNVVQKCKVEMEINDDMRVVRGRVDGNEIDCTTYRRAMYKQAGRR
ncbi:hypothetical protein SAMN05414139_02935 [Burkholderia sp. D7]|nr:hypothetical protein SAMN05414139_02935 [Burkholderia sp. D7]